MGFWSQEYLGVDTLHGIGIVLAGNIPEEYEAKLVEKIKPETTTKLSHHAYTFSHNGKNIALATNVYGAPIMLDLVTSMYDAGIRSIIFIGFAYGGNRQDLPIGSLTLPKTTHHFEGSLQAVEAAETSHADEQLYETLQQLFPTATQVPNISVPAVTYQRTHNNPEYEHIGPATVEMELGACYARAHHIGIRTAGVLIVSDNRTQSISGNIAKKHKIQRETLDVVLAGLDKLHIQPLPEKDFSVGAYLGNIIYDPDNTNNTYN